MSKLNLYTHNGLFHADDVFAAAMLSLIGDVEVTRGDEADIPEDRENWIVFDVGGGELDHHTPECKEANGFHPGTNIPYAACGLVWKKYYEEILRAENCPPRYFNSVYAKLERSLVLGIDAADNGFNPARDLMEQMNMPEEDIRAIIAQANTPYTITDVIKDFNPTWESDRNPDEAFLDAMDFAKDVLLNRLDSIIDALDGRDFVLQHIDYSSDHLLILEQFAPWQGIVTAESHSNAKAKDLWYCISPALRGGWNIQCVLDDPDNRTSYRHPLPESWYGLRGAELAEVSGVESAKFCHPSGFLAGCDTQEGALRMAAIASKLNK